MISQRITFVIHSAEMMPIRMIEPRDHVEYVCVFNASMSYQISHADVLSSATDLEVIEQLLRGESSDISLSRIVRKNESGSRVVDVSHPRYMGPQWNNVVHYVSRGYWAINNINK